MSDEIAASNFDKRRTIGTKLKGLLFNPVKRVEGKNKTPLTFKRSFARATISANDELEDLKMLPLQTDSTVDKICLYKCVKPKCLPPFSKRTAFANKIAKQLPALRAFIIRYRIPAEIQRTEEAQRCGVDTYRNPQVQQKLNAISPEHGLYQAMKVIFMQAPSSPGGAPIIAPNPIAGTATEIYALMQARNPALTKTAISGVQALGTYLTRLEKSPIYPVTSQDKHAGRHVYVIHF